jgi:predicted DNA-binding antitoxin AbrB/MazE fold protein
MMVRAIYEKGSLRLLQPVDLAEGQEVDVTIQPADQPGELTPQEIDARLRAAGLLVEYRYAPPNAKPLSQEERQRIGQLLAGDKTLAQLVDEDRGEY